MLGEDDIVEAQPDIITENAFFRRRSSRCFSGQHRSYFPKLTKALKMPEILNMVTIIGKYLVEKQITILESLCMYGDNSNARFKTAVVGKDALRISNAGNDGICSINEAVDVLRFFKTDVAMALEFFNELGNMRFVGKKTHREVFSGYNARMHAMVARAVFPSPIREIVWKSCLANV